MMKSAANTLKDQEMLYQLEGRPSLKVAVPIGLQHVLAMFTSNLSPVLIMIGLYKNSLSSTQQVSMIQCALFVSGITTLFQLYPIKIGKNYKIGAGLPIVMGTSFSFVPTITTFATQGMAMETLLGALFVASFVEVLMGFFYKPLRKLFSPLVVGSVLVATGIKLLKVGVDYFAGGAHLIGTEDYGSAQNLFLGFLVFTVIILLQRFAKGMWKISAVLIGLIVGYIAAIILKVPNLTVISEASWISLPKPIFSPTELKFDLGAILAFAPLFICSGLETIGSVNGITIAGFDREAKSNEISGGILADAIGSSIATLFNTLPNTAFGQNAGIVAMTKVVNKWSVMMGALILILGAFCPKISAIFNAMPASVLGGAVITVFAMILINGIKIITKAGFSDRNILVLGITFGIGLGFGTYPEAVAGLPVFLQFIFKDTIACICIVSIIANLLFPDKQNEFVKSEKELVKA